MKTKFKLFTGILPVLIFTTILHAHGIEKTKEYSKSWPVKSVETLSVNNKFGEVKVTDKGGSEVTIHVVITVEGKSEKNAEELLKQINVEFEKTGNSIFAETNFIKNFKSRYKFSIDYDVNIPPDKNLNIINKYGSTFVNVLNGSGKFDISYGNFTANELIAPDNGSMTLNLAYGKADVETTSEITVKMSYSKATFGDVEHIDLNSRYSVVNLENAETLIADSRYDTFNFGSVDVFSADTKYTQIRVNEILKELKVNAGYGAVKIGKVDSKFESVSVSNSYGQISIGLGDAVYSLDASCTYCGISYPESRFSGNRLKESQIEKVKGKIGEGNGGSVFIESRYGHIKLE